MLLPYEAVLGSSVFSPVANFPEHGQPVVVHEGRQPVAQLEDEHPQRPPVRGTVVPLVHDDLRARARTRHGVHTVRTVSDATQDGSC
jgi:hypothetical protein